MSDVLRALLKVCAPMAHKTYDAILTFRQNAAYNSARLCRASMNKHLDKLPIDAPRNGRQKKAPAR